MQWQKIRDHFPHQWLLLEALEAHSEGEHRIVDQLAVIGTYTDSPSAFSDYKRLHHSAPNREFYIFHTDRESLDITERHWFGIRDTKRNARVC